MQDYKTQSNRDLVILISVYAVLALVVLLSGGCAAAKPGPAGAPGADSQPCTVTQTDTGATVTCPDGSSATISNGSAGASGADGASCTVSQTESETTITCPDGTTATIPEGSITVGQSHGKSPNK